MKKEDFFYYFIRIITYPISIIPYRSIHIFGNFLGSLAYYFLPHYRKRTLSNLALAKDLKLSNQEIRKTAKKSFQNLAINLLEYPKLFTDKHLEKTIICENPKIANQLSQEGKGIIFFCGHQANWEVLFLDGTSRMKGIAIGKPIKNQKLYQWIVKIREKNQGKIIIPQKAIKEGLRNIRKGIFFGILGDQGMPSSHYSFPFFGRRAWTSTAPALLSYKTQSPIIVAMTRREKGKYYIRYSDPLWPNIEAPIEEESKRLMDLSLTILQESIKQNLGQWLWQHNRWKQQTPHVLLKEFRHDSVAVVLPEEKTLFEQILKAMPTLKKLYPRDFLFLFVPHSYEKENLIDADEVVYYHHFKEVLKKDYRFKLVFNFTPFSSIKTHFEKLSAFSVLSLQDLQKLAQKNHVDDLNDFSKIFMFSLCRKKILETLQPEQEKNYAAKSLLS